MQLIQKLKEKIAWQQLGAIIISSFIVLCIPMQHKIYKPLYPLFQKLSSDRFPFESFFQRKFFFYHSDLALLVVLTFILFAFRKSLKSIFSQKASISLLIFYLVCLVSILVGGYRTLYIQYFFLAQLILCGAMYFLAASAGGLFADKKVILWILTIFVFSSCFESFVAVMQYFTQKSVGLHSLGEHNYNLTSFTGAAIFEMFDGSLWLFDHLFSPSESKVFIRSYGTTAHPNILGGFLALGVVSSFYLFLKVKSFISRFFLSFAISLEFFALLITFSRSALLGLFLACVVFFFLEFFKQKDSSVKRLFFVTTIGFIVSFTLVSPQMLFRAGLYSGGDKQQTKTFKEAESGRILLQNLSYRMFKDSPVLGVGFKNFVIRMDDFLQEEEKSKVERQVVHNVSLLILAETGLIGLLPFLIFLFSLVIPLLKSEASYERSALISLFVVLAFVSLCDHYLVLSQTGRMAFFLVMGLITLYVNRSNKKAAQLL